MDRGAGVGSVVGRDVELARLDEFVTATAGGGTLVLIGGPGIGKTTLWEAATESARARGVRVLSARSPVVGEAQLPYMGLVDLCDRVTDAELTVLPTPRRQVLEGVLMRAAPFDAPASEAAIALASLDVVRGLAARDPVLIAIDDLQWLDPGSSDVLVFLARRIHAARVGFLLARRPGPAQALETVLARGAFDRMQVGPLSFGAVRRLLAERLGLTISRQRLRRIVEATAGNPLFALEVGRSLLDRGGLELDDAIPLPESLEEVLGSRVRRFPGAVRRVLLAVALSEDPRAGQLIAILGEGALDEAVDAGAVVIDGQRVRASHPLLAAAAERRSRARERRDVHLALSGVATDEVARSWHLALATTAPDGELADRVAAAATVARSRGARQQAALLAAHALRLTPAGALKRAERVLELAECLDDAGELRRMTRLLQEEVGSLPSGPLRAQAWVLLSESDAVRSREDQSRYLGRALSECGEDHNLRARVLAKLAGNAAVAAVAELDRAEAWALEALGAAVEPMVVRYALWSLAWVRGLTGRPLDDLCARSAVADDPTAYISASAERVAAYQLVWRGEVASARTALGSLLALADARGDLTSYAIVRMHAVELEVRAGDLAAAAQLLDEWSESTDFETQFRPQYPRCRALLEAGYGRVDEAMRWGGETIALAQAAGSRWDELQGRRALGLAALLEGAPKRAVAELWPVWEHCEREGVRDPGVFPVAPELVAALVELERIEDARAVTDRLCELAVQLDHPWGRASANRCEGLIRLAGSGSIEVGAARLTEASAQLGDLGLRFDSARCLLALGRAQRRAKQWRGARNTLQQAAEALAALGADGWAQRARAELERVGGRRRADGQLTPSERRVVELAAQGRSNKEVAAALYVTVNTVEVHLSRAYGKLGVRSRGQLAQRLAEGP
jgi:DNA-binding CsgD family transcriptional regulator